MWQNFEKFASENWPLVIAITSTHFGYPVMNDQADLAWVAWLNTETVYPLMVTHLGTNPAWCRVNIASGSRYVSWCTLYLLITVRATSVSWFSLWTIRLDARVCDRSSSAKYVVQRTSTKFAECAFSVVGPSAWNSLPAELRLEPDTVVFKRKLKNYLFRSVFIQ